MGFRNYIREFLGANLMLFRPSLPWCFPIRELSFEQKESQEQEHQQQQETVAKITPFSMVQQQEEKPAKIHSSSKKKKQPKSSFSMGFRSYVRHFRGAILGLLRPSLPWCFPIRGPAAAAAKAFIYS